MRRRLAVVQPRALSGTWGYREMTASEGGDVSIGSESVSAFRPEVVLPTASSGAVGDQEMMASEGGVMSIVYSSGLESAFTPKVVVPLPLSGPVGSVR